MAHKVKIGETHFEIKGGKTKVGETNYAIKNGKTRIGETAYKVKIAPTMYTFSITEFDNSRAEVWINGVQILETVTTSLPEGTEIRCLVRGHSSRVIYLNGWPNRVGTVISDTETLYIHRLTSNIRIRMLGNGSLGYGSMYIDEI